MERDGKTIQQRFSFQNIAKKLIPKDSHTMSIDIPRYLERICFKHKPEVSLKCLEELQACHQLTVPFENLDVFTERKKILNVDLIYNQIVLKKRGGWCHELNGLFSSFHTFQKSADSEGHQRRDHRYRAR